MLKPSRAFSMPIQPRKFEVQIPWFIVNELGMKYPMVKIPKMERGANLPS
jgi:hypothetical protein